MLQTLSKAFVADNSGAKVVQCIKVLGDTRRRYAYIGDIIKITVKSIVSGSSKIKKGHVCKAIVVRTVKPLVRADGSTISFDRNAVVLLDDDEKPIATRIFGPVTREIRKDAFLKIISLAPEVI